MKKLVIKIVGICTIASYAHAMELANVEKKATLENAFYVNLKIHRYVPGNTLKDSFICIKNIPNTTSLLSLKRIIAHIFKKSPAHFSLGHTVGLQEMVLYDDQSLKKSLSSLDIVDKTTLWIADEK